MYVVLVTPSGSVRNIGKMSDVDSLVAFIHSLERMGWQPVSWTTRPDNAVFIARFKNDKGEGITVSVRHSGAVT